MGERRNAEERDERSGGESLRATSESVQHAAMSGRTGHEPDSSVPPGSLWLVATPIGNLRDLSPRAADVLRAVDLVLAEDTRRTQQLLHACAIERKSGTLWSLHEHNERERLDAVVERLRAGSTAAIVSDAGTPLVSDPGALLVEACARAGIAVSAVPGPCAAVVALTLAGLPGERFCFEGFLPAKAGARDAALAKLAREERALVFYEAPHRIQAMLDACVAAFGATRRAAVARELTKRFETIYRGTLAELAARASADADFARGELVVVIEGAGEAVAAEPESADGLLRALLAELPLSQAARIAAQATGRGRNELYSRAIELRGSEPGQAD
jgi:16S rRNA (cytidine1402-2'-O)-methyltransferase